MQIADNETNELIVSKTKEFLQEHGLAEADFSARLIPIGNGDFHLIIWSSNRTVLVGALAKSYRAIVEDCLTPHERVLDAAHDAALRELPRFTRPFPEKSR